MRAGSRGTSPWLLAGCGCAALIGLCVVAVTVAGFFGVSMFRGMVEDLSDPEARDARTRAILGAAELPPGYHAHLFFRIPWVLDLAVLSDGPQPQITAEDLDDIDPFDPATMGEHVFFYLAVRGDGDGELEEVFSGRRRRDGAKIELGVRLESEELLDEGSFEVGSQRLDYSAHRGTLVSDEGERVEGVYSQMRIDCPGGGKQRLALWFERDGEQTPDGASPDDASPADESTLRDFMRYFDVCGD